MLAATEHAFWYCCWSGKVEAMTWSWLSCKQSQGSRPVMCIRSLVSVSPNIESHEGTVILDRTSMENSWLTVDISPLRTRGCTPSNLGRVPLDGGISYPLDSVLWKSPKSLLLNSSRGILDKRTFSVVLSRNDRRSIIREKSSRTWQ